jgi:hypothetical protein
VKTADSHRELLAYELQAREASPPRRRRPWPVVGAIFAAVVLVLAGIVIGAVARNRVVEDQRRRAAGAEQQNSSLRQELERNQHAVEEQQQEIGRLQEQQQHLRQKFARETQPTQPPPGPSAASFTDGLYQVDTAIQRGQYHTDGSDSCYWAKLATGDTNRVIDNHVGAGPQTVTIDSPYFESEGCGTWTKFG